MKAHTILCVTEDQAAAQWLAAGLSAIDCALMTTPESQAIALLFLNRKIEAVILDHRNTEHPNLGLAQVMKSLRADVTMLLICPRVLDPLPRYIDVCLCSLVQLQPVVTAVKRMLKSQKAAA